MLPDSTLLAPTGSPHYTLDYLQVAVYAFSFACRFVLIAFSSYLLGWLKLSVRLGIKQIAFISAAGESTTSRALAGWLAWIGVTVF